jgi:hypothetical protein
LTVHLLAVAKAATPPHDPQVRRVDVDRDESLAPDPRDEPVAAEVGESEARGRLELGLTLEVRGRR